MGSGTFLPLTYGFGSGSGWYFCFGICRFPDIFAPVSLAVSRSYSLIGDEAASFTKEEMQQGKHTDYEKQLHEEMLAGLALIAAGESPPSSQLCVEQDTVTGGSFF